ncbi:uncharacterized protein [Panulirus ornatus]|uniref:uncharacterized protein isoform X2 n=1 Tax=Panulirus ornatus TaxID=150431 RepID=UPI003A8A6BFE
MVRVLELPPHGLTGRGVWMWRVWVCIMASSVSATGREEYNVPNSHRQKEHDLFLAFNFEILLEQHLKNWRFLTEKPSTLNVGGVFKKSLVDLQSETQSLERSREVIWVLGDSGGAWGQGEDLGDDRTPRGRRSGNIPVMYMPGKRTRRKCVEVNGIISGYNTFSYLSFITGVISLVLNVNNNINNNNNNNNLNANSAVSNNNVDANVNSNTANQITVFPPGRKRRSLVDVMLQLLANRSTGRVQAPSPLGLDQVRRGAHGRHCRSFREDAVVVVSDSLRLLAAAFTEGVAASLKGAGASPGLRASLCPAMQAHAARGGPGAHIAPALSVSTLGPQGEKKQRPDLQTTKP